MVPLRHLEGLSRALHRATRKSWVCDLVQGCERYRMRMALAPTGIPPVSIRTLSNPMEENLFVKRQFCCTLAPHMLGPCKTGACFRFGFTLIVKVPKPVAGLHCSRCVGHLFHFEMWILILGRKRNLFLCVVSGKLAVPSRGFSDSHKCFHHVQSPLLRLVASRHVSRPAMIQSQFSWGSSLT